MKIQQTMIILEPSHDSMRQFKRAHQELANARENVDAVLARLLGNKSE
jgi:hypothetical protein